MSIQFYFKNNSVVFDNLFNEYWNWRFESNQECTFEFYLRHILNINLQHVSDIIYDESAIIFESEEDMFLFLIEWL